MSKPPQTLRTCANLVICLAVACTVSQTRAQESAGMPGAFLRMALGARATSMGSAYAGVADDATATYWNPAGLHQVSRFRLELISTNMPFDRTANFVGLALPVGRSFSFGMSWREMKVDRIEARTANTADPDYIFASQKSVFLISMARRVTPELALGATLKLVRNEVERSSASGVGVDVAAMIHPFDRVGLGLVLQDIGTHYAWEGGFTERVPITKRLGVCWRPSGNAVLVVDYVKNANSASRLAVGAELRMMPSMPLRLGVNGADISGGLGMAIPLSDHLLTLDYSYSEDRVFNEAIHRISVGFSWSSISKRRTDVRNQKDFVK